MTINYCLLF